jgi:hypothetical protein
VTRRQPSWKLGYFVLMAALGLIGLFLLAFVVLFDLGI